MDIDTFTAAEAIRQGVAYLVDEDGQRLTGTPEEQLLTAKCWAHLQDGATGQWHVHPFQRANELANPLILEMIQPKPGYSTTNV